MLSSKQLFRFGDEPISILKGANDLIVAGYASVEVVDKQGDVITKEALKHAFRKFMENPSYRNVQLAHSNIQIGDVVPNYTDNEGRLWKSEVDDVGMFVVVKLRDDIEKAKEVSAEIRKGVLRGFSIGGQAFKRVRKSDPKRGDYQEISKLELHEITICEKGINPEATFSILKEDKLENNNNTEVNKMTETENDNEMMKQLGSVLSRLEGRLDDMEKGEDVEKKMPAFLEDKKDDKEEKDDKKKEDAEVEKSEYSDVITSDYLNWMEDTLKSAGVDTAEARTHFDDLEKANLGSTPEEIAANHKGLTGQAPGRTQEGGNPSTGAIAATTGGKVKKSDFINPASLSESDIESAYEVYKAAALEEEFRGSLESDFASRYASERTVEVAKAEAAAYDARGPLDDITKAISALSERIDTITTPTETGETIAKSEPSAPALTVPSTADLANMSWDEVHNLASKAFE